jgi:tetratricopeptide (TPR) repeat protein
VPYLELTQALFNHPKIVNPKISKGRFTFEVDELELSGVKFQLARKKNALGIYAPKELEIEEIIRILTPILNEAVGKPVTLKPYAGEVERVPEEHVWDVVSGLASLCHDVSDLGNVKENPMFRMSALQHLYIGYAKLRQVLKDMLNQKNEMECTVNEVASKLEHLLKEINLEDEKVRQVSKHIAERLLTSQGIFEHYLKVYSEAGFYVDFGGKTLAKFENKDEAEEFINKVKFSLKIFTKSNEFEQKLQKYENASNVYERLSPVLHGKGFGYVSERERLGELRFLAIRLVRKIERLKGKCELCGGRFDEQMLEELKQIESLFPTAGTIF